MNKDIKTGKRLLKEFTEASNNMDFTKAQMIIKIIINEDYNGGIKLPLYKTLASKYYWDLKNKKAISIVELDVVISEVLESIETEEEFKLNPVLQYYYWVYHTLILIRRCIDADTIDFRSNIFQLKCVKQMNELIFNIKSKGKFLFLLNEEINRGRNILSFKINYSPGIN